jgi:hypothetical protein
MAGTIRRTLKQWLIHLFSLQSTDRFGNLKHGSQATSEPFGQPNKIDLRDEDGHFVQIWLHE